MGLFTSKIKTTITVATQAMRLVPDNQVPESMRTGAVEALVTNQNLSDTVENKLVDGIGRKMHLIYNAAKKKYFYGLPTGQFLAMQYGDTAVIAALALAEKVKVTDIRLEYSYYMPLNLYHQAWLELIKDHQYDPTTNKLGKLSAQLKQTVYLDDLVLNIEEEESPYLSNITDPWGRPTKSEFSPTRAYAGDSASYVDKSTKVVYNNPVPKLNKVTFHVYYAYNQVVDPVTSPTSVPGTVLKEFTLTPDMSAIESKIDPLTDVETNPYYSNDFYQIKYAVNNVVKFITKEADWLSDRDKAETIFTKPQVSTVEGGLFPFFYFRWDKIDQSIDKTTEAYKDTKRILKSVSLDYDYMCDQIHNEDITEKTGEQETYVDRDPMSSTFEETLTREKTTPVKDANGKTKKKKNPKLKDVKSIIMVMAISANSTNEVDIQYLHAFFSQWATDPNNKSDADVFLTVGNNKTENVRQALLTKLFNLGAENYNAITIQDKRFKISLQHHGITITHRYEPVRAKTAKTYSMSYANGVHTYTFLNSDFTAIDVKVKKLKMTYFIGSGKSATHKESTLGHNDAGDGIETHLLVPIDTRITSMYSLAKKEVLYSRGQHLIYNTEIITKTKIPWWSTGIFMIFVIIIIIVIIVLVAIFAPALLPYMLALAAAMLKAGYIALAIMTILTFIFISAIVMTAIHFILKAVVMLIGPKAAFILAIVVAVAALTVGSIEGLNMLAGVAGATMAPATFILSIATGLMSAANNEYMNQIQNVQDEYKSFLDFTKQNDTELQKAKDLLENNSIILEPFTIPGEKPGEYFDRVIHNGNPAVACFDMLSTFCDILLTLPTLNETIHNTKEE